MTPDLFQNPVLRGFEPDPSILRVGADFYLATSTFEWYPGVRLHHSRDLVNWRPIGGALDEYRLLDLRGVPDSGGIWAPDLSYADGLFHLVFTVVDSYASGWKDMPNYLTTAPSIQGPWSDPVYLHARGFDASLFHDEDGRAYLVNMRLDWRPGRRAFAGIELQEFDLASRRLIGPPVMIFEGTSAGVTEGPHLYRRDDWYYLLVAEGGTGYEHQATVARSRSITGPYEADPNGLLFTSRHDEAWPLQKAGHGCFVDTPHGAWYVAHIAARPLTPRGRCVLGRETAIQPVGWSPDGWPRVAGAVPAVEVPVPDLPSAPVPADESVLGPRWSTLRRPAGEDWVSRTERPGWLRVRGGQSPTGRRAPSLVARRVTDLVSGFSAQVDFHPETTGQLAGITAYYNARNWHYLYLTADDDGTTVLRVLSCVGGSRIDHPDRVELDIDEAIPTLYASLDGSRLEFGYDAGNGRQRLAAKLDATILSDEAADEFEPDGALRSMGFTGAMFGLWAIDLDGGGFHADFTGITA